MASLNKVILIGNLGKDPELRYTKSQTPFARFSIATTEEFTSGGEKQKKTSWHNLVVWGKLAEIAGRYLRKGKQIYVEGKLEYREQDGKNFTNIKVDRFLMLGPSPNQGQYTTAFDNATGGQNPTPQQYGQRGNQGGAQDFGPSPENEEFDDSEIPF